MSYYQHESAIVDEGAQIGEGSRVWHFVHVCGGAKIGWMSQYGEALDLPLTGNAQTVCEHTGDTYVLSGAQLSCIKA